jgi:hypothetical protein
MLYFDTSFITPLLLAEATSEKVADLIRGLRSDDFAISHWTRVEFASLIAREVRMGGLEAPTARSIDARFEALIEESFTVLAPAIEDFDVARRFLATYASALRGGDALHLAIAANRSASAIYSLDKMMIAAGAILGLPVSAGIDGV